MNIDPKVSQALFDEVAKELFLDEIHRGTSHNAAATSAFATAEIFMTARGKHFATKRAFVELGAQPLKGCPSCHSAGKYRQNGSNKPTPCKTCSGSGYVSAVAK